VFPAISQQSGVSWHRAGADALLDDRVIVHAEIPLFINEHHM
jgi:hypothetical protein